MNLQVVIAELGRRLDAAGARYALVGGFAMALRGVQRATGDLELAEHLQIFGLGGKLAARQAIHGAAP